LDSSTDIDSGDIESEQSQQTPLLEVQGVSKTFSAVEALADISFSLEAGEVVGLMGDNGAGKSTLIKLLSGNFTPSSGSIRLAGRKIELTKPSQARELGIETVYQDLALCPNLTACENIFLGREPLIAKLFVNYPKMKEQALELFSRLKSDTAPDALVKDLSGGQRQAVAIARVLASQARIVFFDEPTAAISVRQIPQVLQLIQNLAEQGVGVILISHRMSDVFQVCSKVVVLRRGKKVCEKLCSDSSPEEITGLITGAIDVA